MTDVQVRLQEHILSDRLANWCNHKRPTAYRQEIRESDRETGRQADRQMGWWNQRQVMAHTDSEKSDQRDRETDRQTGR